MLPFANYNISSTTMMDDNNKRKKKKKKRPATVGVGCRGGCGGGCGGGGGGDELAVVKAAAWAWYQRNEGKPIMREFDFTRASRTPRPSRYKLEAAKKAILLENRILAENRVSRSSLWYTDRFLGDRDNRFSDLLDAYEIESISKSIDSIQGPCPLSPISIFRHDHDCDHDCDSGYDDRNRVQKKIMYKNGGGDFGFVKKVSKIKLWKGMILLGPTTVCGRGDDVDTRATSQVRRSPGKVAAAAVAAVRKATGGGAQTGHS